MSSATKSSDVPSVMLISMPWTSVSEPSLGLGILRAVMDRQGIPCRVLHLSPFLLQHLQALTYEAIARVHALNDFLFSGILDPVVTSAQQRWLRQETRILLSEGLIDVRRAGGSEGAVAALLHLRGEVLPAWLAGWADEIARSKSQLVGFTCMFDQTIASLALSKLVRERAPDQMLVLGGYAVRSPTAPMILRSSPWIDAVCDGEGEVTVVELARASVGEIPLSEVPGIVFRTASGEIVATPPPKPVDLDTNPTPNFNDFFNDIRRLSDLHHVAVTPIDLPVENSRGCWWGARSHCSFCGIRDADLAYRVRDARRLLKSMVELQRRYGIDYFRFTDYILPLQYFDTLLPELTRLGKPYRLSAEIKANVTEEQFARLARAGFREVQPGIESFSTDTLRKMHKGVSAVQNVYTLILGRRFGVTVHYNLLYGFPSDETGEYERMVAALPRLVHLDPPVTCVPVLITRWAPLQTRPEAYGIDRARSDPSYELVFSRGYVERMGFNLEDYCYYFERPFENSVRLNRLYERINDIVRGWRLQHLAKQSWLYEDGAIGDPGVTIHDRRGPEEILHRLDSASAEVLHACDHPVTLQTLRDFPFRAVAPAAVDDIVDRLDTLGLVFRDGQRMVSLVLPGPPVSAASSEAKVTGEIPGT